MSRRVLLTSTSLLRFSLLLLSLSCYIPTALAAKTQEEPELASEQVKQEAILEVKFADMKRRYGVGDPRTLEVFFKLFDLWIMLYRLNKADAALSEVLPACRWRQDDFSLKATQALAFTRWKQGRFREALAKFHEMEALLGKNWKLCENIGHTYNAIGALDLAEAYFKDALTLTHALPEGTETNEGGIWLGLAGVQDRRGNQEMALLSAMQSYAFYKTRDETIGWESSLTAKAAMSISGLQLKLGNLTVAEEKVREAIRLFDKTAGEDSPLVASALHRLGAILVQLNRSFEAKPILHRAYRLEAVKDAFDLVATLEIHNLLVDAHLDPTVGLDRASFKDFFGTVDQVVQRVRSELPQDGNAGAYYKAAGELHILGEDCRVGQRLLTEAIALFLVETSVDTTGLIKQCQDLIEHCNGEGLARDGHVSPPAANPSTPAGHDRSEEL